jgi:tRNA dimethylallyltransferase
VPGIIAILGPTAVGKSELGIRVALAFGGEIVNADALQVYRGLDIGTAKPSEQDRERVPHHLLDIRDPRQKFSAGEFARLATAAIAELHGRGRNAVVVGGSGLYLRALLEGIAPMPAPEPAVRAVLIERLEREGLPALYGELLERDPRTAARLMPNDRQRILRALEVALATGRPMSEWQSAHPFGAARVAATRIGLTLPRSVLYDRIAARVVHMHARGLAREVQRLLDAGVPADAPAFQAIGYREIARHLRGEWTVEQALAETVAASRRYAKRQETWWRREVDVAWFDAVDLDGAESDALAHLDSAGFRRV